MTMAEKANGFISKAQDADPYLAKVRAAVAREAQTYNPNYREGSGQGLRYTAFSRYAELAQQSVDRITEAQRGLAAFRAGTKPLDPTETQLRAFRQAYEAIPWNDVSEQLDNAKFEEPGVPAYSDFVDRSVSGQEDLMVAFQELFANPGSRHAFALALAAFIDIIVFLLAYASGPYFFGSPEHRWLRGSAVLDGIDSQVFARGFLRKLAASPRGMARADAAALTPGEQQLCMLLISKGLAAPVEEDGKLWYLLDESIHEHLLDLVAAQNIRLRATMHAA
jgi:hypothetical protein